MTDPRLSGFPDGTDFIEGKGPLGRGRFGVCLPGERMIGNLHATHEAAATEARGILATRAAWVVEEARRAATDAAISARLLAGEEPTDADLRYLNLRTPSRFDYLSPIVQRLFGLSRAKVRIAMGDALRESVSDFGHTTFWASPRKALMNAAAYVKEENSCLS